MDKYAIEMLFWAEQDLNEIALYYKSLSNELGDKFYYQVRKVIESLKVNPFYQTDFGNIRKIPVQKFPYKVFFKVDEENKIVYIEAIISDHILPFSTKIK
ncbi:type II toxin-antitoxin system RelE/ParE family toxin [Flavobacterium nackdongense]|uniref:Type II toxin-antitoxin system RelE/ParE family toxin n=1 Tax=Flavobacterium nackdongense TaxID=2547394 RepID=A0A4P6YEQ2_9FLAO|nr:type II toxin-antitoxin system RelE/ParE family toxin [Flavobacterium nackdongense]QBN19275.1 type II toxin-antitoxin system RelE/ParE family toxin [Flavobacterium nackdongense]